MASTTTDWTQFALYRYVPSLPAAIVFIVLFMITAIFHTYQLIRSRAWFYLPMVIGAHFEWIGYIGRALGHSEAPNYTLGPYILQSIVLLIAPALFAATIYMTLGRIVRILKAENLLFIRASWLTKIFVCGDIFSFLIQSSGAGLMAGGASDMSVGSNIVVGGLVLQILFFGIFVVASVLFHVRMNKNAQRWSLAADIPWVKHMVALYVGSLLILIRSVFRVVEFAQGNAGYIMSHEWFLYVFDAVLMFVVIAMFNFVHGAELKKYMTPTYVHHEVEQNSMGSLRSHGHKRSESQSLK